MVNLARLGIVAAIVVAVATAPAEVIAGVFILGCVAVATLRPRSDSPETTGIDRT